MEDTDTHHFPRALAVALLDEVTRGFPDTPNYPTALADGRKGPL